MTRAPFFYLLRALSSFAYSAKDEMIFACGGFIFYLVYPVAILSILLSIGQLSAFSLRCSLRCSLRLCVKKCIRHLR